MKGMIKKSEFVKEFNELQREVQRITKGSFEVYKVSHEDQPILIGVNWCGTITGAVSKEQAAEVAKMLVQASELAKNFKYNGYRVW